MLRRLPRAAIAVLLALILAEIIAGLLEGFVGSLFGRALLHTLASVAAIYAAAPYQIALYRFVANDEIIPNPETLRSSQAGQFFAGWGALGTFIFSLPTLVDALLGPIPETSKIMAGAPVDGIRLLLNLAVLIAIWIIAVRLITFLPALALDPQRTSLRRAFDATRGHFWFIAITAILSSLPPLVAFFMAAILVTLVLGAGGAIFGITLLGAILALVLLLIGISISARLYQRLHLAEAGT